MGLLLAGTVAGAVASTVAGTATAQTASQASVPAAAPIIQVAQGTLSGLQKGNVQAFLGVPYAAPPTGERRWRAPVPAAGWAGIRSAQKFGASCLQGQGKAMSGKEDCLNLNIYRPANSKNAPVMVWIHGGFFTGGDSSLFSGEALAREFGVVVVTVNYRLGVMGFLAAPGLGDGNYGLMDIAESLRWVQQNAASFGGNPGNVTVFGNSAGGAAICTLLTAPSAAGLFQKAIIQSGPCVSQVLIKPLSEARAAGQRFVNRFHCGKEAVTDCLRRQSAQALSAVPLPARSPLDPVPLPPVYGDALIPNWPQDAFLRGNFTRVPVLLGSNAQEGRVFEPYLPGLLAGSRLLYLAGLAALDARNARTLAQHYPASAYPTPLRAVTTLLTHQVFSCPTLWLGRQFSRFTPTFMYEFSDPDALFQRDKKSSPVTLGPYHASEIPYVLDTAVSGVANPADFSPAQQKLSHQMGEYWTNFARTGYPAALALTPWPALSLNKPQVMTLEPGKSSLRQDFAEGHQCPFWDGLDKRIGL